MAVANGGAILAEWTLEHIGNSPFLWVLIVVIISTVKRIARCQTETAAKFPSYEKIKEHSDRPETVEWFPSYETFKEHSDRPATLEWFNFLLSRWWMFGPKKNEKLIKEFINKLRPKPVFPWYVDIKLQKFSLGEQTPYLENTSCTFHRTPGCVEGDHQLVVEIDFNMGLHDYCMIFKCRALGLEFDLEVIHLHLKGTLQTTISLSKKLPLPHISKVTVCFKKRPEVNYQMKKFGWIIKFYPESWIRESIMNSLTNAMVHPNRLEIYVNPKQPRNGKDTLEETVEDTYAALFQQLLSGNIGKI